MKLLSIAIPCHNAQAYMEKAVESLLPGGDEVEILIVDDGSADDTAQIADRYAQQYPGIVRAIHQANGGHGDAVMTGLKNATGLYFKVVDSDDWADAEAYLSLTAEEIEILAELTQLKADGRLDSIVVLLNTADIFETAFLDDNWTVDVNGATCTVDVDACLWVGNVGIGGIQAVAKALTGQVTPSGKLPDTYVKDNFSAPATASWILSNDSGTISSKYENGELLTSDFQTRYGVYVEGIYVGYRYYETRYEDVVMGRENTGDYSYQDTVSRAFGCGLSYTTFGFSDYAVTEAEGGDCQVSVTVTNTGSVSGKEVVQVYLQKPYTDYDQEMGIEKASVELVGFDKTETLAPGESQQVTITVSRDSFKTYDANGYETYILEPGEYYLAIGVSAHDALNNILALKGKSTLDGMDQDGNAAFAQQVGQDIVLDTETYTVSAETGEAITNRLDFADINKYEGRGDNEVTYVSRKDWAGTFPVEPVILTATEQMAADLQSMQVLADDGEVTMPAYGAASGLSLIMLRGEDYDAEMWDDLLDQMTWEEQSNLVMLAGCGTRGASMVALPEIKAEDGPTGVVDSAESVSFPSEGIWAATFNRALICKIGDALAEDGPEHGCHGHVSAGREHPPYALWRLHP